MAAYQIDQWLQHATSRLEAAEVPSSRLDALILLEDATGRDRAWILAHPEHELGKESIHKLNLQIQRRTKHEPLAYIRGKCEFYGREFIVSPATLQPRPETETMISLLLSLPLPKSAQLADIGTGSGAIAISTKLEIPEATLYATDIQPDALEIADENAKKLHAEVTFLKGNLLEPLKNTKLDVILANLPYVPNDHVINQAAMQEPKIAIFGGEDGLDLYREMFMQLELLREKPKYIFTESLPFQHKSLAKIAQDFGYSLEQTDDFIQLFKLIGRAPAVKGIT